jgi:DnaJ-class molecular chaperone
MGGFDATASEHQRISLDAADYSDEFWQVCDACNGSGNNPIGSNQICFACKGEGEKPKESVSYE